MKKSWLRNSVIILLAILLLGGLILSANGSSQIYLMSVNDTVMEVTANNMPIISDNQIHIPYTMLSSQVTGINLGVRAQYNASRGTLVVTDGVKTVTFDVRNNAVYTSTGETLSARAVVRNSMAFLPVSWLCSYFNGLRCSLNYTSYGILVRLTNDAVVLTDAEFIDAADSLLSQNVRRYQNSLVPSPSQGVSPSPPPPSLTPPPITSPDPEPVPLVYLAFRWGSLASEMADVLEANGQRGLFLFDYKQLMQQDDLIRRLIGRGHQVGLTLTSGDVDYCLSQLEYGRQLITGISRSSLLIISNDELGRNERQALEEMGCAVWTATLRADGMSSYALSRQLKSGAPNYVELTCNQDGLDLLEDILLYVHAGGYHLRQALAPML